MMETCVAMDLIDGVVDVLICICSETNRGRSEGEKAGGVEGAPAIYLLRARIVTDLRRSKSVRKCLQERLFFCLCFAFSFGSDRRLRNAGCAMARACRAFLVLLFLRKGRGAIFFFVSSRLTQALCAKLL